MSYFSEKAEHNDSDSEDTTSDDSDIAKITFRHGQTYKNIYTSSDSEENATTTPKRNRSTASNGSLRSNENDFKGDVAKLKQNSIESKGIFDTFSFTHIYS